MLVILVKEPQLPLVPAGVAWGAGLSGGVPVPQTGAGSPAHGEEHHPGEEKTLMGSAAPAGTSEPGTRRREGFEARWKQGFGLGFR